MTHYFLLSLLFLLINQVQVKPGYKIAPPPGSVQLENNLYIDRVEVTNAHWLNYLRDLRNDSSEEAYRRALPDTTVWNSVDKTGKLSRTYLRSYKYLLHPVVGINYEQAVAYNRWRSVVTTNAYNNRYRNKLKRKGLQNYRIVLTWRLPTVQEWEMAAAGGMEPAENPYGIRKNRYRSFSFKNTIIYDSLGNRRPELFPILKRELRRNPIPLFNCMNTFGKGFRFGPHIPHHTPFYTSKGQPIFVTLPNDKGLFDTIGNVAEMTSEKGIAKGGSWMHLLEFSKIRMKQTYKGPAPWLGLRSICEVKLEPVEKSEARLTAVAP